MMPRFVVDLERLKYLHCGLGQFSLHFGQALLRECSPGWHPVLLLPATEKSRFDVSEILTASPWRKESVQRWLRPLLRHRPGHRRFDLWHVTHQDSHFWPLDVTIPVVLTIHDLNFLRTKSERTIRRRIQTLQGKIDRAAVLTTGSGHAAGEIREHFYLGEKALHVIPNGVCLGTTTMPERPADVQGQSKFLFTISDIRPSKNFHTLIDMLVHLPEFSLVIAGSKKDPYASAMEQQAAQLGLSSRVILPGRVTEAERLWLYQHCEALVFPSLAEGFGLPLIEAMHCGRPVFSSRCTSLPEVGGPLASYWDSFEATHMAAVVRAGLKDFAAQPNRAESLRAWSRQFTWQRVALRYLELYHDILSDRVAESRAA